MAPPAIPSGVVRPTPESDYSLHVSSPDTEAREPPSYSPPSYLQTRDLKVLPFREINAELPPIQTSSSPDGNGARHKPLPSISTVTSSAESQRSPPNPSGSEQSSAAPLPTNHWPSLNPLTAYYTPGHVQSGDSPLRMDVDSSSTSTGPAGATSPDRYLDGRAGSVSLDDPDVRLAAEALGDLRADFVSSPPARSSTLPATSSPNTSTKSEPLLSLLTTSHPLLAKTIEGTTSAYNNSKNFSPRFKSGAEYVEGYLTPIGNTIGSVSRVTGVEGGVRWFLGGGRRQRHQHPSSADGESSKPSFYKRRKIDLRRGRAGSSATRELQPAAAASKSPGPELPSRSEPTAEGDAFDFNEERRLSMSTVETLPAYDDHRSPDYTESVDGSLQLESATENTNSRQQISGPAAWQTRLIMSTSGLSIAMSEESLRSLKYCLNWLRWANAHIDKVISALKAALEQYDSTHGNGSAEASEEAGETGTTNDAAQADRNELAARIAALRGDLLQTLRGVVDTVSKYAGGALPDNARLLVRRHLTSLPQRFRLANQADSSASETGQPATDKEVREGAQRVLVLAKEGLDMMSQVSGVLDGTIVSAEEWCERLGKKKRDDRDDRDDHDDRDGRDRTVEQPMLQALPPTESNSDVIMQQ